MRSPARISTRSLPALLWIALSASWPRETTRSLHDWERRYSEMARPMPGDVLVLCRRQ